MSINVKKKLRKKVNQRFTARDFDSYRRSLLQHARVFYPDKISDFSEASVGGLLLDLAASVGDSLSFYLDHMFNELDPATAVDGTNILAHARRSGIKSPAASPSSGEVVVSFQCPAERVSIPTANGSEVRYFPKLSALPIIYAGTSFVSGDSNINFILTENLNFAEKDSAGNFKAGFTTVASNEVGQPSLMEVSMTGVVISGTESEENFTFGADHVPFRQISLSNPNVHTILSVTDSDGNEYHEVETLSQDTVFVGVDNLKSDSDTVSQNLELMPAPRRYVKTIGSATNSCTLVFGSGDPDVLDDDILPDPSDVALELFGKKTFQRLSIDPGSLLKTQTLGIAPKSTTLTVKYRHGGGITHNANPQAINTIERLSMVFRGNPTTDEALQVRSSLAVVNNSSTGGGADAASIQDVKGLIATSVNSQNRIVTKQDLLARIYSMPTNFGRVFRAAVEPSPVNPLSNNLFVICKDSVGSLEIAPDSLKDNLSVYLNEYRLISDAVDILDAGIYNFGIEFEVLIRPGVERVGILRRIINAVAGEFRIDNFHIGQPIILDDISNIIINDRDVVSLVNLRVFPRVGNQGGIFYSNLSFGFEESTRLGILRPPTGGIFELKEPALDIIGSAV